MNEFEPQTIDDHATQPTKKHDRRRVEGRASSGMDQFTGTTGRRIAKSVTGAPGKETDRAKKFKRKPFWQLAPNGTTIERLYDPADEPLTV